MSGVPQETRIDTAHRRLSKHKGMSARQFLPACAETVGNSEFVFGRDKEIAELGERLSARESFVLHGPSGSGKTFLLHRVMQAFPEVLYCSDATSPLLVFQSLTLALLASRDRSVRRWLRNPQAVKSKSAVSLRGIVLDAV
jgi:type IV secretory pathway ATPase VirB11/archaellum biosynthesis ATPase